MIFFPSDDRALIEFILSTFNYRKNINIKKDTAPRKGKKRKLELSSSNSTNTAGFFYFTLNKL
jgi:hypothetical protein